MQLLIMQCFNREGASRVVVGNGYGNGDGLPVASARVCYGCYRSQIIQNSGISNLKSILRRWCFSFFASGRLYFSPV